MTVRIASRPPHDRGRRPRRRLPADVARRRRADRRRAPARRRAASRRTPSSTGGRSTGRSSARPRHPRRPRAIAPSRASAPARAGDRLRGGRQRRRLARRRRGARRRGHDRRSTTSTARPSTSATSPACSRSGPCRPRATRHRGSRCSTPAARLPSADGGAPVVQAPAPRAAPWRSPTRTAQLVAPGRVGGRDAHLGAFTTQRQVPVSV